MRHFLIGLILGLAFVPIAALTYLRFGNPPVAVNDPAFPLEAKIVKVPLHDRIHMDMQKSVPIQATPDNLLAGAKIYVMNCSTCHGTSSERSPMGPNMYPHPPQLLHEHGTHGVVGVSDDPPAVTYWKVDNGIRLTGMPTFAKLLTPTQMWQVSLLLANAATPLPQPVKDILAKPLAN